MTAAHPMPPARRGPIPGMSPARSAPPPPPPADDVAPIATDDELAPDDGVVVSESAPASRPTGTSSRLRPARRAATNEDGASIRRRPAADYATTRLVNFRIPVDLHDRYRQLVRDAERQHPRLRHPSLTELVTALLEEGPDTAAEVAEVIRRKRAAEHAQDG